jgi:hypothetical protein
VGPLEFFGIVYIFPVEDVKSFRNLIVASLQIICNIPGIWDDFRVAMRCQDEACTQAGGGYVEHLL